MRKAPKNPSKSSQQDGELANKPKPSALMWSWTILFVGLALLARPAVSLAAGKVGTGTARPSIDFRIVIPAIICVRSVSQPDHIVIEAKHIAQGYIDLDVGTSVKLTSNTREGYLLSASYDPKVLSSVEVRVSSQNMTASSGFGSMRVASGLAIDKLIEISYRLHLLPGVRAGDYRWPVALAFSLAAA